MDHAPVPDSITTRLIEGFERIALVLRAELWAACGAAGVNPAQAQVLALLSGRRDGLRAREIAEHMAVAPPTIADTLAALDRKGLVVRAPDPADARASRVRVTEEGRRVGGLVAQASSQVRAAVAALTPSEQADLMLAQIKIIHALQQAGAIPVQRMCVSCRHFRPNAHPGEAQPHHCAFVNAPIGGRDIRLDCSEHEAADPAVRSANWTAFQAERPPLQAKP